MMPVLFGQSISGFPAAFGCEGGKSTIGWARRPLEGLYRRDNAIGSGSIPRGDWSPSVAAILHNFVRTVRPQSGPQIEIALRLQLGDPDHAASFGGHEAGEQVL